MKAQPQFAAYPEASAPAYRRWLAAGTVLLALLGSAGVLLRPLLEARVTALIAAGALLLWLLALLLRTLSYRLNRHNAFHYAQEVARVERAWWSRHRRQVSLLGALLIGAAGTTREHWQLVLDNQKPPPQPKNERGGMAIRSSTVFATEATEREAQLAGLLALQWREQLPTTLNAAPVACYWQGSASAWQAFVEDMTRACPDLGLPERPEPWSGQQTLEALIARLQEQPEPARILCAGCHSGVPLQESARPAGEAAVLWLLGRSGAGARFTCGEWYAQGQDTLADVAARAQRQSELDNPPAITVTFRQPEIPALAECGWRLDGHQQDSNWGDLGPLEAMVVQTLAACYAEHHRQPCGWLAKDPAYTLALGIVKPDE